MPWTRTSDWPRLSKEGGVNGVGMGGRGGGHQGPRRGGMLGRISGRESSGHV